MAWVGSPEVRRDRTQRALLRLRGEVEAWFADRATRPADELGRHTNPLRVLAGVLQRALERLASELDAVTSTEAAFARCGGTDPGAVPLPFLEQGRAEQLRAARILVARILGRLAGAGCISRHVRSNA